MEREVWWTKGQGWVKELDMTKATLAHRLMNLSSVLFIQKQIQSIFYTTDPNTIYLCYEVTQLMFC